MPPQPHTVVIGAPGPGVIFMNPGHGKGKGWKGGHGGGRGSGWKGGRRW